MSSSSISPVPEEIGTVVLDGADRSKESLEAKASQALSRLRGNRDPDRRSETILVELADQTERREVLLPGSLPVAAAPPVRWLGRVAHADAVALQEAHRDRILAGDRAAAVVLLCEHEPVITLGRNAVRANVLADDATLAARGVTLAPVSRGGDVTYHGPGQLMVYPIVPVRGSVVAFLETIAGALAEVAAALGVPGAAWQRDPAGLWLGGRKLAACGINLRRGVPVHGWALNLATPPAMWALIVPCGLTSAPISVLDARGERGLPPPPPVAEVAALAAPVLARALAIRSPQ